MVTITDTEINALLGLFLWPFTRITGLLAADPVYSSASVPMTYKAGFALFLTLLIAPVLPPFPAVPLVSAEGAAILIQQWLIGFAMGFVMNLLMTSVAMAGSLISTQMGLGFAMFFDPQNGAQTPAVSTLMTLFVTLLFFSFNGHLVLLATLADSFKVIPVGQSVPLMTWRVLAEWGGHIFSWGLWLSLPVIASLMVANLAIGVMTRAAPQFNILSFGFPLTLSIGMIALYLALPSMEPNIEQMYRESFEFMLAMFKAH